MNKGDKYKNFGQGKKFLFESLVSISLLIVFILVIITGLLSHQRLNLIIETVKSGIRPDRKLILVKEITNNLSEAENSVKSFSLTRNGEYLVRFYELTDNTGQKFKELDELIPDGDPLVPYSDTLNQLVGEKFTILDRLLSIQDEFRVQQAMQQVVQSLQEQEQDNLKEDTVSMPVLIQETQDTVKAEVTDKKENFFSRLFKKKNKQVKDTTDSSQVAVALEPVQPQIEIKEEEVEPATSKVEKVRDNVLLRDRRLRQEEWELLQQDKEIMQKINRLISYFEEKENAHRKVITEEAELKAGEVKRIIIAFGIAASFFILFAALVIYRYIRRNNEYKAVLEQSKKDAEELAKAKELFLANMSHEIRTPMNIISGFLNQVLKGPLDAKQQEQLNIISKSSDHLLQLLNDLLDLSKLQADRLELVEKNFSPADIIEEIRLFFEPAANAKKIGLTVTADPGLPAKVFGDPVRLRQILFNLVGNAIKFTGKGKVTLTSYVSEKANDMTFIGFEVTDTGIGMQEEDLERIFGVFEKAGKPGSNTEGAGLGLSITLKLVNLIGGNIKAESKPGEGSAFRVVLPYKNAGANLPAESPDRITDTKLFRGLHVLVVDDDEYNRRLARIILEKYGCEVSESGSAEEAIDQMDGSATDFVLMDIHLPGMKGTDAAGKIKEIGQLAGKKIRVIAVSASISKGELELFRKKGLDDFVLKPYKEETLIETISRFIEDKTGNLPVYDLAPLREISGGSDEFAREMIALFIKDTDEGLIRLKDLVQEDKWNEASELAHKMLSPCRHLKAARLADLLKNIENAAEKTAVRTVAMDTLMKARKEFELIRDEIIRRKEL